MASFAEEDPDTLRRSHPTGTLERAVLVGTIDPDRSEPEEPLSELAGLASSAGVDIAASLTQKRDRPSPKYFIGTGKVTELSRLIHDHGADVVIFDNDLTPAQVRNLERELKRRVLDRTELILDIFATHARTQQAKLQVELAQLEYAVPRLRSWGLHLTSEQQAGGTGMGVGMRGPGEKQLEEDKRHARRRILNLRREIREIEQHKRREVSARSAENYCVSLVGYTNAGKSTLMNALTRAGVLVEDRMFSTLDTRTRLWHLKNGGRVLLSDTVGFIRKLPHALVASFHATLEEVAQADLLLHVVDASHPEAEQHMRAVQDVLAELECADKPSLVVFNKIDKLRDALELSILRNRHPQCVGISAVTGAGLDELDRRITEVLASRLVEMDLLVPVSEGKLLSEILSHSVVLEQSFVDEHVRMRVRAPRFAVWKLERFSNHLTTNK
ncbi:MAG: GTPase HflX [Planctomycetes bacterium]|nr:GTPase HflX [Planctomycetota bacterium]